MTADSDLKAPIDPEVKLRRKAAQTIAYEIWLRDWRRAHPKASRAARDQAWAAVRGAELKKARRVLAALDRGGFRVVRTTG